MADQQDKKSKNTGGANASPMSETNISKGRNAASNTPAIPATGGVNKETSFDRTSSASGGGTATATARSFYDQAKETAGQAYEVVTDKAATKLEEQKSTLTDGLSTVADSIRQAGDKLGSPANKSGLTETAAKYTDTAAQKIEQAARYFEQRDVKQMVRDVESYAKRNPAVFIGGAFAAGVLLSRFLKAGTPRYVGSNEGFSRGSGGMSGSAGMNSNVRDFGGNAEQQRDQPNDLTTSREPGRNQF